MFNFLRTGKLLSKWFYYFTFPAAVYESSSYRTSLQKHCMISLFNFSYLNSIYHIVILICISLMTKILNLFSCAYLPFLYLFFKSSNFLSTLKLISFIIISYYREFQICSRYKSIVRYIICKDYLPIYGWQP